MNENIFSEKDKRCKAKMRSDVGGNGWRGRGGNEGVVKHPETSIKYLLMVVFFVVSHLHGNNGGMDYNIK